MKRRSSGRSRQSPRRAENIQPVLDAIARTAARLCEAHDAMILRVEGDTMRHVAKYGRLRAMRGVGETFPLSRDWVGGRAVIDGKTVHIRDLTRAAGFATSRAFARLTRARTFLATPLLQNGTAVGAILIRRTRVRPFTAKQIALLKTFAAQAAIAIENARLSRELEARNADLTDALEQHTATGEILHVISRSPTDVQPTFEAIAASAVRLCDAGEGTVFRFDGALIHVAAHHGRAQSDLVRSVFPRPPGRGSVTARAILTGAVVHLPDAAADPELESSPLLTQGFRTVLSVPMLRDGAPIGAITVTRRKVDSFTNQQVALLQTFADQAVIAIENVRLFKELESRNRALTQALDQQTATSEILRVISSSPTDLQPVFDSIAASATRLCEALFGLVFRFHGEMITLVAHDSATPEQLRAIRSVYPMPPGGQSVAARAIHERRVIAIADSQTSTEYPHIAERARAIGYRSLVSVPMLRGGAAIGAINVVRAEATPFTDAQIELLKTFADQAVIAIENVRLFKELEARNRELTTALEQQTATSEILRVISSSPTDVQPIFDTIAENAVRLCGGSGCGVFRFDGELIHAVAVAPGAGEAVDYWRRQFPRPMGDGRGPVAHVLRTRAVLNIPNVMEHPVAAPRTHEFARRFGYRSQLVVPMLREGTPIGVISVFRTERGPFTDRQVELLRTFADQAVIAIENVRLFAELQARTAQLTHSVDELTALGEVSRALSSTLDLETVLNTIVARANQLAGTDACSVWEY
ncbi:MAG TPA: GAF domain-containing protein, partial [Candidatus Acidoferrum sp.]|nr:GAF domain-containing protein [Candidatus Acidoferrum sp.]